MDRKSKIALYLIVFVILLMVVAEITKPKAVIWRDSYSAADKIPLGCFVLYNELKNDYPADFKVSNQNIYDYLRRNDSVEGSTLLFINDFINFGEEDSESLLEFVENGNEVLISTMYFNGLLADTLNVQISRDYQNFVKQESQHGFSNPSLEKYGKKFSDVIENGYLSSFDTLQTTILGTVTNEDQEITHTNFVKINFGENNGAFFIHTNPFAFSNYHMLDDKDAYAAAVLSYLPQKTLIWDNYYKSGRKIITSPLRFVLTNSALKWAFYTALVALLLFVLFKGKRTQRIIPVREPLKNSTVDFTQTIGDLYFQNGDYTDIISKKIAYFLDHIRTNYYLMADRLDATFVEKLSSKSGHSIETTKTIVDAIIFLRSKNQHTENDLRKLNDLIENFTHKTS